MGFTLQIIYGDFFCFEDKDNRKIINNLDSALDCIYWRPRIDPPANANANGQLKMI